MQPFNWLLRLLLFLYAGYLIDSVYFSHLQTPWGRGLLVALLLLYLAWFYRWESSAVACLVFLVPLSAVVPRVFGLRLPPFHALFTSAFVLAVAAKPMVESLGRLFARDPFSDTPLQSEPRNRTNLESLVTLIASTWIAFCVISFVFVSLRYMNLYPFSGDPLYNYVITRQGHRSAEGILLSRWTLASYANSAIFLLYLLTSRQVNKATVSQCLNWLFASYCCVSIVAFLQSRYQLGFLNADGIWPATQRLNATFDDPNALACSLILVFPLAILGPMYLAGVGRALALMAIVSSLYLLYLAASRTAFAGFVLGMVLIAVLLGWRALRNRHYALVLGLVLLGGTVLVGSLLVLEKGPRDVLVVARVAEMWDYLKQNWQQGSGLNQVEKVAYSRQFWWPSAIRMFREHPLTGVGIGVFQFETVNHGSPFDSAGNQYLQTGAEYGISGLLFTVGLALVVVSCLVRLARNCTREPLGDYLRQTAFCAALLAFAIGLFFGSHLLFHQVGFVFALVLGAFVLDSSKRSQSLSSEIPRRWVTIAVLSTAVFLLAQFFTLSHSNPVDFRKDLIGKEQDLFGYPPEMWLGEFEFRWLTSVNSKRITVDQPVLKYALHTPNPAAGSTGINVSFFLDDRLLKTVKLTDHGWHNQEISVPPDMIGKSGVLKIVVDRTWHPPGEFRQLGVALRECGPATVNP